MIVLCYLMYLVGAVCFILGLRGLSHPNTARRGNLTAAAGMTLALVASLIYPLESAPGNYVWIFGSLAIGALLGWISAARVAMTAMPQMVSVFNGLGGGSAMLLAVIEFSNLLLLDLQNELLIFTLLFTLFVGAVSFSGSILAYLKLDGRVKDHNIVLPWHQVLNVFLLAASIASLAYAWYNPSTFSLALAALISLVYGFSFVAPIGGADMPVVISLLNSITGISAASAGFLYQNQIMILGGILVGASGTILTVLMCDAMNRSLANVILGNFSASAGSGQKEDQDQAVQSVQAVDVAILLNYSSRVMLVPGYGMAVAQAQKQAKELDQMLAEKDIEVYYGIHPVAGRMPGHMNVLLAEVDIGYDKLLDLEQANKTLEETDIVLIVGANDVVNPSAVDDPSSSIYGMPVIEAWNAKRVVVLKRSMSPGYAGIQNPLFFKENTNMLFGDAAKSLQAIIDEIKSLG